MAIIYRTTDRIPVSIGDCEFVFAPISQSQKIQLTQRFQGLQPDDVAASIDMSKELLKQVIKDVKGIFLSDGSKWEVEFDAGQISSNSLDEILSLECAGDLLKVAGQFLARVPREGKLIDPSTGEPMAGVEVKKMR